MYAFQSRIPLDHIMSFVQLVQSEERNLSDGLKLVGAITGELGALLSTNFSVQNEDWEVPETIDGCVLAIEPMTQPSVQVEPNFDITPFIPIILKLIELWLARKK